MSFSDMDDYRASMFNSEGLGYFRWRSNYRNLNWSRRSALDKIEEGLTDGKIGKIGVFGMGGIGKTKLMTDLTYRVQHQVLFARVSRNPNIRNIQQQLANGLNLEFTEDTDSGRAHELGERIEMEFDILIILDDVWGKLDMESIIGVAHYEGCCKIILTTCDEQVCKDMGCNLILGLDLVQDDEAWDLFSLNASCTSLFHSMASKMASECGGLPLTIVAVARALKGKTLKEYDEALQKLWNYRFDDLGSADSRRNIYAGLKLSYEYLSDKETQMCFMLCSHLTEDSNITVEDLTMYAFQLGLFENVGSVDQSRSRMCESVEKLQAARLLTLEKVLSSITIT